MKHSKRFREALSKVDRTREYTLDEAIEVLLSVPTVKFDETVEIAMKLGIDTKKSDQMVRGTISLPKGIGRTLRVIAFADGDQAKQAAEAGADAVGGEELAKKIQEGWLEFDVAIATPPTMRYVGRLGRILGPQGKMPSPKSGTVTDDIATAVREFKAGKIEFRADATGCVHAPMGKRSFPKEDLKVNIEAFLEHVRASKPPSSKGKYIQKVSLSTTMGPGLKLAVG
jgi:large subunit ribosomal protein L1